MRANQGLMLGLVLGAWITAGCADRSEQDTAVQVERSAAASDAGPLGTTTPDDRGCPPLGELTETWHAAGTPLVFDFRHPPGFEVRKSQVVGPMYQVDLVKSVELDGRPREVTISILQFVEPVADEIPAGVKAALDHADSPAMQALAELLPRPAGEISFGGASVALFRTETEDKAQYKFNLPGEGGFYSVDVGFVPTTQSTACSERLKALGEQWVQELSPANS